MKSTQLCFKLHILTSLSVMKTTRTTPILNVNGNGLRVLQSSSNRRTTPNVWLRLLTSSTSIRGLIFTICMANATISIQGRPSTIRLISWIISSGERWSAAKQDITRSMPQLKNGHHGPSFRTSISNKTSKMATLRNMNMKRLSHFLPKVQSLKKVIKKRVKKMIQQTYLNVTLESHLSLISIELMLERLCTSQRLYQSSIHAPMLSLRSGLKTQLEPKRFGKHSAPSTSCSRCQVTSIWFLALKVPSTGWRQWRRRSPKNGDHTLLTTN